LIKNCNVESTSISVTLIFHVNSKMLNFKGSVTFFAWSRYRWQRREEIVFISFGYHGDWAGLYQIQPD